MARPMFHIPLPRDWDVFEDLCLALWTELLGDRGTQRHGRRGQRQFGVDILGRCTRRAILVGVQCKLKDRSKRALTEEELRTEVAKAKMFKPQLGEFVIVTTLRRDTKTQAAAQSIAGDLARNGLFAFSVWSWDDIEAELRQRDHLMRRFYPTLSMVSDIRPLEGGGILFTVVAHQRLEPLLSGAEVRARIIEPLRLDMKDAIQEIALNAFEHGGARSVEVEVSSAAVCIRDDGARFDPLDKVTAGATPAVGRGRGVGLTFLRLFLDRYANTLTATHAYTARGNETTLRFSSPMTSATLLQTCRIAADLGAALTATDAERLADSVDIPPDCAVLTLSLPLRVLNPSSLYRFLERLLSRIPNSSILDVQVPRDDLFADVLESFGNPRLRISRFQ